MIQTLLLLYSVVGFAQENSEQEILIADSTWVKEILKFPLGFAQEIKYEGHEELRFAPGFSKENSPELWSYAWAWVIKNDKSIVIEELEINLQYYFDGLLNLDPKYNKDKPQQTLAILAKNQTKNNSIMQYIGKLKTTDTRYTHKPITLNINGEQFYCKTTKRTIIVFRLSPQDFRNDTWKTLNAITLHEGICD